MGYRYAATVLFAALFGSLFLPWVRLAQFERIVPAALIAEADPAAISVDSLEQALQSGDPIAWTVALVAASLALAGIGLLLALGGWVPRVHGLLTGAVALLAAGYGYGALAAQTPRAFQPRSGNSGAFDAVLAPDSLRMVGEGAILYVAAAALLVLTTLFWPRRRRRMD